MIKKECFGKHYSKQSIYLNNTVKMHVLKFENLKEEFDNLMKLYGYNFTLDLHENKGINRVFDVSDLSIDVINLINEVYHDDFI